MEQKIQQLESQVNQLLARLAQEQAREQELKRARDLAWDTYKTLVTKEAELKVAAQTQGTEVALAAPAAVPQNDLVSGTRNVALAALIGLMLGVGAAYFIEFWWSYKGLQPQPITLIGIFRGIELQPIPVEKKQA
jgi:succinoglycan biosynthesis transport protein ExoP